ncbi:hypothetical protein HPB48_012807 [Haemaphysalis longicornis]|uniref:ABC-2 type transporter transmembrane domain-containing protein n=1 Tax=Haemaphysalis longicornis TaxID=44386 RepID=A0A9J6FXZ7_HAELO|nr:hypothetical protein HPB48_012807 [Haemaphysalis longicornis]
MGALSQVYAIVWKDVYVQTIRRHYLVTAFEVALIFLSFFGVERDRPLVAPPAHCSQQPPPCLTQPVDYAERNETDFRPPQMILYTPQAGNERLVKAAFVSKEGRGVRTQGYSSEEKMLRAFYKLCPMPNSGPEQRIIALVFGSPNGANDLEFTVRFFDQAEYVARRGKAFPSFATLPNPVSQRESVAYCQIALVRAKTAEILANATREGKTGARRRQYVMTTQRMSEGPLPVDAESERWLMIVRLGIGYLVPFTVLVTRLSAEAQSGLREKLRLSGLNDAVYWLGHFLSAMFIGLVSVAFIVTYMAFVEHRDGDLRSSFLEGTDTAVVLVCMLLFSLHYITSAMVLSLFLRHAGLSALFSMAYWVSAYVVPWLALEDTRGLAAHYVRLSRATKLVTSLLPCAALHWCFRIIGCANLVGEPYSMSSVTGYVLELDNVTMLEVWVVMLAYAVTMCVAIWYLGNVLPWTRGVPRPLLFPFTASYWMPSGQGEFRMLKPAIPDGVHFEPYPLDKHEAVFVNR